MDRCKPQCGGEPDRKNGADQPLNGMKFHYWWECRFHTMDLLRCSQGASLLTLAVWCCPNRKCSFYCVNHSYVKLFRSRANWAGRGRRIISREVLHPAQKTRSAGL